VNSPDTGIVLNGDQPHDRSLRSRLFGPARHQHEYGPSVELSGLSQQTMLHNTTITNNNIHDNVQLGWPYGQAISVIADGFLISATPSTTTKRKASPPGSGAIHGQISNNVVYGNGAAGIYTDGVSYVNITNNQVYGNPRGIGISSENPYYSSHD